MPAIARFLYITIDAQDAERIADFWAAVLDTELEEEPTRRATSSTSFALAPP